MKIISAIGHPLLMATYLSFILLLKAPELFAIPIHAAWYFLLAIFLTTCLIPAFIIFSFRLFSKVSSLELIDREERPIPFLFIFIWYGVACFLFVDRLQLGAPFSTIIVSITILIGLLLITTRWFKISIHSTAIWSGAGIFSALTITYGVVMPEIIFGSILLAGLTSTSRLYLGYHQPKEVWSGTILGFCFCFLAIYFLG
ncbi:MAG: hypothetical protein RIM99_05135 [Cyclobacteriaceae bacterium]